MAAIVELLGPHQESVTVSNTIDFNQYVFGMGYKPTQMTVAAAYELLLSAPGGGNSGGALSYLTQAQGDLRYILRDSQSAYITKAEALALFVQSGGNNGGGGVGGGNGGAYVLIFTDPDEPRPDYGGPILWLGPNLPNNADKSWGDTYGRLVDVSPPSSTGTYPSATTYPSSTLYPSA